MLVPELSGWVVEKTWAYLIAHGMARYFRGGGQLGIVDPVGPGFFHSQRCSAYLSAGRGRIKTGPT
jgi:hypothetical protein